MAHEEMIEAVRAGDVARVRAALAADAAAAGARDANGVPVRMLALYRGLPDLARILAEAGPPLDAFEAAALGEVGRLRALLDQQPSLVAAHSADGFTALHFAAFFGSERAATLLLERGADPDAASLNPMRVAPLHSAVATRRHSIIARLLEHGANPNARQQEGWTVLHGAANEGELATVELLLEHGADPRARHDGGKSAADIAREKGHEEIARRLDAG